MIEIRGLKTIKTDETILLKGARMSAMNEMALSRPLSLKTGLFIAENRRTAALFS
ncbi:MAG TPA: hypothetical protein P5044_05135 [bacterium]|nr:hypothetical protein [bacterium]